MVHSGKTTYSYHHFFFPFKWDVLPVNFNAKQKKENLSFAERADMNEFDNLLTQNNSWERKRFQILEASDYNEWIYFYAFARKSLYDTQDSANFDYEVMRYYEYFLPADGAYTIEYYIGDEKKKDKKTNKIELTIQGISLHIFNTGTGILAFNLANQKQDQNNKETILIINEIGRRIYPQFIGPDKTIERTRYAFLAYKITVDTCTDKFKETFENYNFDLKNISVHKTFLPPSFISGLFDADKFIFHIEQVVEKKIILLSKVMDDRMFFLCWYGDNQLTQSPNARCFKNWDWWYAFIFGDKLFKSIGNSAMQENQLLKHTYARWAEYGTLYGMSRDSFVCLSPDEKLLTENPTIPRFDIQMNTMYYQIAVLCLVQRASILKFSAEISNLSYVVKTEGLNNEISQRVRDVYGNYLEFRNKIYFKEITSQIQGIEIYEQFQTVMNIPNELQVLEEKIRALHEFLSLEEAENMNSEMHLLTKIATIFLPATFLASLFSLLASKDFNLKNPDPYTTIAITLALIIVILAIVFYGLIIKKILKLDNAKWNKNILKNKS